MAKVRIECEQDDLQQSLIVAAAVAGMMHMCAELPDSFGSGDTRVSLKELKHVVDCTARDAQIATLAMMNPAPLPEPDNATERVNHIGH